ncbi:MAG: hypothetical protein L0Y66_21970 [Myxococcaceae bacterium]|nr:hypothetical protein [Myxococcaceae bacterium]MCI0672337.1 hypothetical protein [Myxococcaceae bacterium]
MKKLLAAFAVALVAIAWAAPGSGQAQEKGMWPEEPYKGTGGAGMDAGMDAGMKPRKGTMMDAGMGGAGMEEGTGGSGMDDPMKETPDQADPGMTQPPDD